MEYMYTVYGTQRSYFTLKLESALIYYGVPWRHISKRPDNTELVEKRAATHQIPVLQTPENWMINDTTPIISMMDARYPLRRLVPTGPLGVLVHLVEEFMDEWLSRTMVHYRWNFEESAKVVVKAMLEEVMPDASAEVAEQMAQAVYTFGRKACRANGLDSDQQKKKTEEEYEGILVAAQKQLSETPFLLGSRPCVVDTIFLGGLKAHMFVDPAPRKMLEAYPALIDWLTKRADHWDGTGELHPFPESTGFARYILKLMKSTYLNYLMANTTAVKQGDKAFVTEMYGEEVSYKRLDYREESRQMILRRITDQLTDQERETVERWVIDCDLDSAFLP
ncbi:MAG: glutathione S-transferase family protein [Deltaproteobacteria bacterium]|jgi:glutathione S-transferase|nr:glutathione S-transferase family protein [Deltaproteobacteria bacterium]MBT4638530.1 glutathione S-transferase family protein [Deltaproteobacteria bacterium]MBT6499865.1 glutathione S-transferase family protein [Deltaproteobacteria bacterium]MBT6612690.1 glutathione S-transferase family protein [Deltaproteobacteria bacterium]MBT7153779.1 glutathione S-transferase family protein [Deltaproteobacteria bacterium]